MRIPALEEARRRAEQEVYVPEGFKDEESRVLDDELKRGFEELRLRHQQLADQFQLLADDWMMVSYAWAGVGVIAFLVLIALVTKRVGLW